MKQPSLNNISYNSNPLPTKSTTIFKCLDCENQKTIEWDYNSSSLVNSLSIDNEDKSLKLSAWEELTNTNKDNNIVNKGICIKCVEEFKNNWLDSVTYVTNDQNNLVDALKNLITDVNNFPSSITDDKFDTEEWHYLNWIEKANNEYSKTTELIKTGRNKLLQLSLEEEEWWKELNNIENKSEYNNTTKNIKNAQWKYIKDTIAKTGNVEVTVSEWYQIQNNESSSLSALSSAISNSLYTINKIHFDINNWDSLNKGLSNILELTLIIASCLKYNNNDIILYPNIMRSYIWVGSNKWYPLFIWSMNSQNIKIFCDGMNMFYRYLNNLISYINAKYNIGDIWFNWVKWKEHKIECVVLEIKDVLHLWQRLLFHKKLSNWYQ